MVESSDEMWSTGEGNGKILQYSCFENPMNSMKRQKDMALKDELPKLRNNSRKNDETEPKQKQHSVVSDPQRPHGLQPTRLLHPWDFPGKNTGVGCHFLLTG